jgi:hypothetical protein
MKTTPPLDPLPTADAAVSAAIYSRLLLSVYDPLVLGLSCSLVWHCPSRLILDFYNQHISGHHLDVGVGTGYFLDRCTFPASRPTIALADLNTNPLQVTARRIRRYHPTVHRVNVLAPLHIEPAGFDSIGLNYLLHCLPGDMLSKAVVFRHLKPLLNPQAGVIFGATLLGQGVRRNLLARLLMRVYNARGIFHNAADDPAGLERVLSDNFRDYSLNIVGCTAFFAGRP